MIAKGYVRHEFQSMVAATILRLVLIPLAAATGNILLVGATGLVCGIAELIIFIMQMERLDNLGLHAARSGMIRLTTGLILAAALARWSGLGWSWVLGRPHYAPGLGICLFHLLILAGIVLTSLWGCVAALWWLSGYPEGPERLALSAARAVAASVLTRLRTACRVTRSG